MKNVHLLPTDKPSRLYTNHGQLHLDSIFQQSNGHTINQNVYITSDEEIKKGDKGWLLENNGITKNINQYDCTNGLGGIYPTDKKIILTTDQDLIADGVQAIDDEFLEWFVKNLNCEGVEVEKQMLCDYCGQEHCDNFRCRGYKDSVWYEIIIPREEPKQDTIEEAADNWVRKPVIGTKRESFIAGANYQAERMYTYDEMRTIAYNAYCKGQLDNPTEGKFNEWIQQFKKN